jgi:hypothetical protein
MRFGDVFSMLEEAGIDIRATYWSDGGPINAYYDHHRKDWVADPEIDFVVETPDGLHRQVTEVHVVELFVSGPDGPVAAGKRIVVVVD